MCGREMNNRKGMTIDTVGITFARYFRTENISALVSYEKLEKNIDML